MRERHEISGQDTVSVRHRVPAFFLSRGRGERQEKEGKRKQEKGNASQALPSDCLHIVFSRDMPRCARDMLVKIGGNPPFLLGNREIYGPEWVRR